MKSLSIFVFTLLLSQSTYGINIKDVPQKVQDQVGPTIEIRDRYDEVILGMTESKIYMIVTEHLKEQMNEDLERAHLSDIQSFNDSNGLFILGNYQPLLSNRIEYLRNDIHDISLKNGELHFEYKNMHSVLFDDIQSSNGKSVLANFSQEDLLNFVKHFKNS